MSLANIRSIINELPTAEIKYHLLLLMSALENHHMESGPFIKELELFINDVKLLMVTINVQISTEQLPVQFDAINARYQKLLNLSKTNTLAVKIGYALLHVIGAIAAVLSGLIGGLIGGIAGFSRGVWNATNLLKATGVGVVLGLALGGIIGFRSPKKIAKNEFIRQLKYSLDGICECIVKTQAQINAPLSSYETLVINKYFSGDREKFDQFKSLDGLTYSVETIKATFISPSLENYLGHHSLIKIQHDLIEIKPEKGENTDVALLEFSTDKADISRPKSETNCDIRKNVSGSKLVEMLLFHEQLQMTHAATTNYLVTQMKQGEVDCLSYVNKILTGTSQNATNVKRFDGTENNVGKYVVGFFIQKLHPFSQDALIQQTPSS